MGQGFSLSDDNLNKLYDGTAKKNDSVSITQGGWTITVTNKGPKPKQEMTHHLYSMTAMVDGSKIQKGEPIEITLSANRGENDKANMRNKINREMNKLQDAMSASNKPSLKL